MNTIYKILNNVIISLVLLNFVSCANDVNAPIIQVTHKTFIRTNVKPNVTPEKPVIIGRNTGDNPIQIINNRPDNRPESAETKLSVIQAAIAKKNNSDESGEIQNQPLQQRYLIDDINWLKPTNGKIIHAYNAETKGIDIAAPAGQSVFAAQSGKVVYSDNGLRGYGNLIIIKHKNNYLTAYSHNKVNLVHDGAIVKQGQEIAIVGMSDANTSMLHFELRHNGKPIDPTIIWK